MRKIRNSCAHNERIYTLKRRGRIIERYLRQLPRSYCRENEQKIMDLLIYLKYYLHHSDYKSLLYSVKTLLERLEANISANAFNNVRAAMGIKDISHLDLLLTDNNKKEYNKF